jgi:hypothetical protein
MAFEYSDGYRTRLKIHKYASFATLPLFVAQFAVGQKLYDGNGSDGTRSLHGVLAGGTAVLFGVNTVTGVWNLSEGRRDPNHRQTDGPRHPDGVADAGFGDRPHDPRANTRFESERRHQQLDPPRGGAHLDEIATVAYLMMLIH